MENVDKVIAEILEGGEIAGGRSKKHGKRKSASRAPSGRGTVGSVINSFFNGGGIADVFSGNKVSGGRGGSGRKKIRGRSKVRGGEEPVKGGDAPVEGGVSKRRRRAGKKVTGGDAAVEAAPVSGGEVPSPAAVAEVPAPIAGGEAAPIPAEVSPAAPIAGGQAVVETPVAAEAPIAGGVAIEAVSAGGVAVEADSGAPKGGRVMNDKMRKHHASVMERFEKMKKMSKYNNVPRNKLLTMAMKSKSKRM